MPEDPERRLIVLPPSPWSERARWALDHHRLPYRQIAHMPFLGERRLRRLLGQGAESGGRATVPVLLVGGEILKDSWDIARYADREGRAEKLIPTELDAEVRRWNGLADSAMGAARALTVRALLASDGALDESHPPGVPRFLRPLLRPITRYGTAWFARKYTLDLEDTATPKRVVNEALAALRAALGSSGYVLGRFTYADVVMATLLQGIIPVADRYVRLGPATRQAWTQEDLAKANSDLIAWRDGIYDRHRRPSAATA
jgi:glutathione S-transferase